MSTTFHTLGIIFNIISVIDNHRVLHGRSAFNGKRRMCGAYIGADEFRSRLSVLAERFGENEAENGSRDVPAARRLTVWRRSNVRARQLVEGDSTWGRAAAE